MLGIKKPNNPFATNSGLHLAALTRDCKVFQNQTPVQVIEAVLTDYPYASDKRLIETYPARDYCVQYNESDFEFITCLMQESPSVTIVVQSLEATNSSH